MNRKATGHFIALIIAAVFSCFLTGCTGNKAMKSDESKDTYTIVKTDNTPDWNNVPVLNIDHVLWTDDYGIRAQGQLCFSDEALFVHLSAAEEDVRAENTEPLSPVYEDSCLEFFFQIMGEQNYFNFEINPNGCLGIQFGPAKTDRINIVRSDAQEYFDIQAQRTADGWEVFYRIPLKFIRLFYPEYEFKGELAANFYKCGNKTRNKHYLSWSLIDLDAPNFHCPEYFGLLVFEK